MGNDTFSLAPSQDALTHTDCHNVQSPFLASAMFRSRLAHRNRHKNDPWSVTSLEPRILLAGDAGAVVADSAAAPDTSAAEVSGMLESRSDLPVAIVFVDAAVGDIADVAGPIAAGAELILIDSDTDGIQQISRHLQQRSDVKSVHVVSHGSAGQIQLGATILSGETLGEHVEEIRGWSEALAGDADLLFYGCDVASDSSGKRLLGEIARLSGADVAASTDRTANDRHHGDWDLEYHVGSIEAKIALTDHAIEAFEQHLAIEIHAAGSTAEEEMQLLIDGSVVATWSITGNGAYTGQFDTYTANIDGIDVDRIRVAYTNDLYIPEEGIDRNLRVDWIRVDGVQYETEAPGVFSTGTWINGLGIEPGNWETEFLHTDGYFQYVDDGSTVNNGTISVASTQVDVDEDAGTVSVVLQRTGGTDGAAEVFYQTVAGSAHDGSDFTPVSSASVVFDDGQDTATIEISITNDSEDEPAESFEVHLLSVDGADLGTSTTTTVTIQDDDDPPPPEPDGLIGYWNLNETSAFGPIGDSSGLGNHGQALNFAPPNGPVADTPDTSGANPGAFRFDGGSDYIDIAENESLRLTNGTYSQALWIKPTANDDLFHGVIGHQEGPLAGTRYPFVYVKGDAIYAGFGTGGNTWKGVVAEGVITTGDWNHVAVTFDGGTMQLFVGGNLVATNSNFAGSLPTTQYAQLNIGRVNTQFIGLIDEVRMYDRALTEAEVQSLIQPGDPDPPVTGPGMIGLVTTQVTVNEDASIASIGLQRVDGTDGPAEVFYQTQDASATNGIDYVGTASGSVLFADGQDFATIDIPIIDNGDDDGDKTFQVSLFRVEGAAQGEPRTATVTIVDDESGSGLIGYWNLNETSTAGPIADSSGQGNDGQAVNFAGSGGPSTDAPDTDTFNPGAFRFDGGSDAIEVGPSESLRLTEGRYSQSVWIKPTANDEMFRGVIGYQVGPLAGTRYPFIYTKNDAIYAGFGTGGNTWKGVIADDVITVGVWNHVAVTFDGTTMQLYVNGEVVATNADFAGDLPPDAVSQLSIGKINTEFVGLIDEVRMYDRVISGAEVQNLIDGATLPPPNIVGFFTQDVLASGFFQPTTIEQLPDGRMLVAEREGIIRLVNQDGSVESTPFLDINDIVNRVGVDRGLMSIAIGPDFATNPQIYVAYTYDPPEVQGQTGDGGPDGEGGRVARVSRFTVNSSWTEADRDSEYVVVGKNSTYENIGQPNRRPLLSDPPSGVDENGDFIPDFIASDELSHTVGDMEFGPDGMLYISTGDGGSYGRVDPINLRALDVNSLNGKILRVDPVTGLGLSDNPFYDGDLNSNASRVYSYGLRNPFRFAINPNDGEVFIADVGWLNWEEINTGRGKNFGWPAYEGLGLTGGDRGSYADLPEVQAYLATNPEITPPIWTRSHAAGGVAIIMGDFIQGGDYPESLQGAFLFTDIGDQVLRAGRVDQNGQLFDVVPVSTSLGFITDVMRMADGSLFYVDFVSGTIGRLNFNV